LPGSLATTEMACAISFGRRHHKLCGDRRPDVPDRPRLNQE
jgi:hypothetical protein